MYQLRRIWAGVRRLRSSVNGCGTASVTARRTRLDAPAHTAYVIAAPQSWPTRSIGLPGDSCSIIASTSVASVSRSNGPSRGDGA